MFGWYARKGRSYTWCDKHLKRDFGNACRHVNGSSGLLKSVLCGKKMYFMKKDVRAYSMPIRRKILHRA